RFSRDWSSDVCSSDLKNSLDKRIRAWSEDWITQRGRDKNRVQSWFELTGYAEDLIFGRWWMDDGVDSIIAFKAVVIDVQAERIRSEERRVGNARSDRA